MSPGILLGMLFSFAAQTAPAQWQLTPIGELGGAEVDGPYVFDRVTRAGLAGTPRGDLFVLDPSSKRVL